jgi:hypothetical protein
MHMGSPRKHWQALLPALGAVALAVFMTWPLAPNMGTVARTGVRVNSDARFGTNADGMFSLWNVSWVARTLLEDPRNLFNANIFFPHKNSLAYSEPNLVAGAMGAPVWWVTRNPYATLNFVVLVAFAAAWYFTWRLVRHLTGNSIAGAVAGVLFAFCPYVFAHTAHIQLMLTAGIPASMLALHHLADAPSLRRGALLGAALLIQALACAYYGIFAALIVGYGVLFLAVSRSLIKDARWWISIGIAAAIALAGTLPVMAPFIEIRDEGFGRTLEESAAYSANLSSYLVSSAYAHSWLRRALSGWPAWNEVMFPGFLTLALAACGGWLAARGTGVRHARETALLYGTFGVLACWASFGPSGGLYRLLYEIPVFAFLRAPARLAIVVVLALTVLGGLATAHLLASAGRYRRWAAAALLIIAIGEMATPMPWERAVRLPAPYANLAQMPPGPIAEFPFHTRRPHLQTQYMLYSTLHWMPMLNGYSDHEPPEFSSEASALETFPSDDSFHVLRALGVRYVGVHWDRYGTRAGEIRGRLQPYKRYLTPVAMSGRTELYEIISFP